MTDAEKCRMIAEFEGWKPCYAEFNTSRSDITYCKNCGGIFATPQEHHDPIRPMPDYPHDLNATMRAARRLPATAHLQVCADGMATFCTNRDFEKFIEGDPARAAFEALAAYLMERQK